GRGGSGGRGGPGAARARARRRAAAGRRRFACGAGNARRAPPSFPRSPARARRLSCRSDRSTPAQRPETPRSRAGTAVAKQAARRTTKEIRMLSYETILAASQRVNLGGQGLIGGRTRLRRRPAVL